MSDIPVIAGGAAIDCKPYIIVGGVEVPVYDAYVIAGGGAIKVYQSGYPYITAIGNSGDDQGQNQATVTFSDPLPINPADSITIYGYCAEDGWYVNTRLILTFSDGTSFYKYGEAQKDGSGQNIQMSSAISSTKYLSRLDGMVFNADYRGTTTLNTLVIKINGIQYNLLQSGEINL
jgi:hypothetical protein